MALGRASMSDRTGMARINEVGCRGPPCRRCTVTPCRCRKWSGSVWPIEGVYALVLHPERSSDSVRYLRVRVSIEEACLLRVAVIDATAEPPDFAVLNKSMVNLTIEQEGVRDPVKVGVGENKRYGCRHIRTGNCPRPAHMRTRLPLPHLQQGSPAAHICAGTGAHPCHICAGTGARPGLICTGTGAHPCHICTGTGAHPCHI